MKKKLEEFKKEFKKQLATLLVGAFSFVSALLWRDAINAALNAYIQSIKSTIPIRNVYLINFVVALAVTFISVLAIYIISKLLSE